jgi:nucleoside 2-deoxyribosyltransferase
VSAKPIVYLAGGIAGLSGKHATTWRSVADSYLRERGVETLSPMRAKHALQDTPTISTDFHDYAKHGVFYGSREIMVRDFNDVKRCDALLVNLLGLKKPSIGTAMELAWAYAMQKPAVVVIEPSGNPHDGHPMLHEAIPFRVATLLDGIDAVAVILGR